jgi:hypothetical protein
MPEPTFLAKSGSNNEVAESRCPDSVHAGEDAVSP